MNRLLTRVAEWADTGYLTTADLARFRIIYAVIALIKLPDMFALSKVPDAWYDPPPGPFQLLDGFPPTWTLIGVEVVAATALAALLIGWRTKAASITSGSALLVAAGLVFSQGKIDHTILFVLTPLVMSFSSWGDELSVDAQTRSGRRSATPQWPMRLLSVMIGVAFMTAALQKAVTGWLSPDSQAAMGHLVGGYVTGRDGWLSGVVVNVSWWPFWEMLDWLTVGLEASVLVAALSWRTFTLVLSVAAVFHLSVLLMMNITFVGNVVVYAAFVRWGVVLRPLERGRERSRHRSPSWFRAPALVAGIATLSILISQTLPEVERLTGLLVLFAGGVVGIASILLRIVAVSRRRPLTAAAEGTA